MKVISGIPGDGMEQEEFAGMEDPAPFIDDVTLPVVIIRIGVYKKKAEQGAEGQREKYKVAERLLSRRH